MKKCFSLCLLLMLTALELSFAQEFFFAGEIKTGVYWESRQTGNGESRQLMQIGNTNDAGGFNPATGFINIPGRFRLDLEFKPIPSMGFKVRFEDTKFTGASIFWAYSYAYGNFLNDQLKLSAGNLGESPWKTEGPEIWGAIDERPGIRTEYKPNFVPGLNIGFVLNQRNNMLATTTKGYEDDFANFMKETVFGVAYAPNLFDLRFSWRLDGQDEDNLQYEDGHSMVYRLEEKMLRNLVPGLSVWANGLWRGMINGDNSMKDYQNWLYIGFVEYGVDAQMRIGYQMGNKTGDDYYKKILTLKPVVSYSFVPMISAGLSFTFAKDFGSLSQVVYDNMTIEPQIKITFNSNAYVAFVYGFQQLPRVGAVEKANYINLRLVYSI